MKNFVSYMLTGAAILILPAVAFAQWSGPSATPPGNNPAGPVWLQGANPTAQTGNVSITGGAGLGDYYISNGKAIRADAGGASSLNIGNWGAGATGFLANINGDLYIRDQDKSSPYSGRLVVPQICLNNTGSASTNCITSWPSAGGGGDLTEVVAGTGITVTNGTGPIPTVSLNTTYTDGRYGDLTAVTAGTGITVTNGTGPIPTVALDTTYADDRYVNVPGDSMTGNLTISKDTPSLTLEDTGESNKYIQLLYQSGWGRIYTDGSNIYTNRMFRADGGLNVGDDEGFYRSGEDQIRTQDDALSVAGDTYLEHKVYVDDTVCVGCDDSSTGYMMRVVGGSGGAGGVEAVHANGVNRGVLATPSSGVYGYGDATGIDGRSPNYGVYAYGSGSGSFGIYADTQYGVAGGYFRNKNGTTLNSQAWLANGNYSFYGEGAFYNNGYAVIDGGTDVAPNGGGYVIVGAESGSNIGLDSNEIMARDGGAASNLHLEADGGADVTMFNNVSGGQIRFQPTARIGIGTTSPSQSIHVSNTGDAGIYLEADTDDSGEYDNSFVIMTDDGGASSLVVGLNGVAGYSPEGVSYTDALANAGFLGTGGSLQFGTGGAVRATLESGGDFGIGITNPAVKLHVYDTADTNVFRIQDSDGTCSANPESGSVTWTCSSDIKLKTDIKPLEGGLNAIMGLKPDTYRLKVNGEVEVGFIAQDVQQVLPNLVSEVDEDGTLGVAQDGMIPYMVKAIQELKEENDALKARIEKLEAAK